MIWQGESKNDTWGGTGNPQSRVWGFGRRGGRAVRSWTGPLLGGHSSLGLWVMKKTWISPGCRVLGDFTDAEAYLFHGSKTWPVSSAPAVLCILSYVLWQGLGAVIPDGHEQTYDPDLCFQMPFCTKHFFSFSNMKKVLRERRHISKGHRSQLEGASYRQMWGTFSIKINIRS